ncbi:MAG: D-glucuronyl C5-epimerase family protein [bacterium]
MNNNLRYLSRILNAYIFNRHDSNLSFWHTPLSANALGSDDLQGVRRYPMNFAAKTAYEGPRDADGVIMLNYYGDIGVQYNPNAIAQQALGFYDLYLDAGRSEDREAFLTQANYFLKHGRTVRDGVLLWEYTFPFEMRNRLQAPWRSALAQGQAISVLIRAYQLTRDGRYADAAHSGYNSFRYPVGKHEGGVVLEQDGYQWLEEYIVEPANHVLNGFVWALWGVRDYAVAFNDPHARALWESCQRTLQTHLPRYDLGFWTAYDWPHGSDASLPVMPASIYYQKLHAVQMEACYNLTGDPIFREYGKLWNGYLNSCWKTAVSQTWKIYFKLRYF